MTENATQLHLAALPPFSLSAVALSHGWIQLPPFGYDRDSGTLTYVTRLGSDTITGLQIAEVRDGVDVTAGATLTAQEQAELAAQVTWMLGLNQDLVPFHTQARGEPKLAHVIGSARGRILRSSTLFEDTVKTILTTNTSWAGTIRMVEALVSRFGDPLPDDRTRHAFPTPARLASTEVQTLRLVARLGYRAPHVLDLARAVASGDLDLESLQTTDEPSEQLRARLLEINGVGAYSAANLLIILGRYDFIPVDSWARKLVSHEWYGGESVRSTDVEAAFERWGEWKGLAYWFWDWAYMAQD